MNSQNGPEGEHICIQTHSAQLQFSVLCARCPRLCHYAVCLPTRRSPGKGAMHRHPEDRMSQVLPQPLWGGLPVAHAQSGLLGRD